jgi:hypothetical protein
MSSLDSGLGQESDGTPIRGREVVRLICSDCGSAVIGKVMADNGWRVWINAYAKPRGDYGSTRGRCSQGYRGQTAPRSWLPRCGAVVRNPRRAGRANGEAV